MKKKLAKLLVLSLICCVVFGLAVPARAAGSKTMRIGLIFGDSAAASSKLTNAAGTGFRFGYYDGDRNFVSLGWTEESSINVLITQNLYLNASGGYGYSSENNRGAVGCYHVHLPWAYDSFDAAQAAAGQVEDGFVAWIGGSYYVRMGSYNRRADAEAAVAALGEAGVELGETSGYGYSVVAAGTTRILFQFDADLAGEAGAFAVQPGPEDSGAVTTLNGGNRYRGGLRFERINGGASTVVNMVDLESYVKGVIPYEMSASWPLEALKAQAVCARTYAVRNTRHSKNHFDLCTTVDCQVYQGIGRADENSDRAVDETAGQMAYYNGKLIDSLYYSSNGGASEDSKNIWGNEFAYLKGKQDPYEADVADIAGNYRWSKVYTAAELKAKLNEKGYPSGDVVNVAPQLSAQGNVIGLTFTDAAGKNYTISPGERVRNFLGVNSIRFSVSASGGAQQQTSTGYQVAGAQTAAASLDGLYALGGDGTVKALPAQSYIITGDGVKALEPTAPADTAGSGAGSYTFSGTGWGHNVGMSQWGANAMAKRGYTYLDILKFYYTDITVE